MASSRHNIAPDPNQGQLFGVDDILLEVEPERPAAFVDLVDRAQALSRLLGMLNQDNRANGLVKAAGSEIHRRKLANRYGENLDKVVDGSSRSKLSRGREITEKYWFARAAGLHALEKLDPSSEAPKKIVRDEYKDFMNEFGIGMADAKKRNQKIASLNKAAPRR